MGAASGAWVVLSTLACGRAELPDPTRPVVPHREAPPGIKVVGTEGAEDLGSSGEIPSFGSKSRMLPEGGVACAGPWGEAGWEGEGMGGAKPGWEMPL